MGCSQEMQSTEQPAHTTHLFLCPSLSRAKLANLGTVHLGPLPFLLLRLKLFRLRQLRPGCGLYWSCSVNQLLSTTIHSRYTGGRANSSFIFNSQRFSPAWNTLRLQKLPGCFRRDPFKAQQCFLTTPETSCTKPLLQRLAEPPTVTLYSEGTAAIEDTSN